MKKILIFALSLVCVWCLGAWVNHALNITELQEKYPQFFDLSTDDDLNVFIWQMSEDNYSCWLDNRDADAFVEEIYVSGVGTSIEEMKVILSTYDVEKEDIVICPVIHPLSSYCQEIDDAYREKVEDLFWND